MLMRKCKSKSESALCRMKRVCRDWHYGRVHLTNRRPLLVPNASKWEGKLFCWAGFCSSKCWCGFCRRFAVFVCHDAGSQQGDEDVGMGPCWSWAQGPWFRCCTSSEAELGCCLPSWGAAEVLPAEALGLLWMGWLSLGK